MKIEIPWIIDGSKPEDHEDVLAFYRLHTFLGEAKDYFICGKYDKRLDRVHTDQDRWWDFYSYSAEIDTDGGLLGWIPTKWLDINKLGNANNSKN